MNSRKNSPFNYSKEVARDILLPGLYGQFIDVPDFVVDIQIVKDGLLVGGWRKKKFLHFKITDKELKNGSFKRKFSPQCAKLRREVSGMTPGQQHDRQQERKRLRADKIFAEIKKIRKTNKFRWDDLEEFAGDYIAYDIDQRDDKRVLTLKYSLIQNEKEAKKIIKRISEGDYKVAHLLEQLVNAD